MTPFPKRRSLLTLLLVVAVGYLLVVAALWLLQDRMVFPGAGRGDRGVPVTSPPGVVSWLGDGERRTRLVTIASANPTAVAVYFGGNGEDLFAAAFGAASIAAYGVEAIGVEYPGYGASAGKPSVASLLATADAATAHARARAAALGVPLVLVGSSLGSFCAVHAAAIGGADKLLLRAPPTALVAVAQGTFPWLPVGLLLAHRFDNLANAARVQCPVLVVHGDADTIVPQRFGKELAAALRAQFVSVPGLGHNDLDLSPAGPAGDVVRAFLSAR
ncbi:MAG: alpha/beta hydrolase [Planctomycetota bacterium]